VYVRRGRYQLRRTDGTARTYQTLDEVLVAWAAEYGGVVGDLIDAIISDYRIHILPTKARSTQVEYSKALKRLSVVFGTIRLRDLRPVHVYRYQDLRAEEGAKVLVNREIAVLSALCNHGVKLGHADYNVCKQVRRRPEKPRDRYVTDQELAIVYGLASDWMKRAIRMACITGIRLGDLVRITDENRTEEGFYYRQGKTGRKMLIEWTEPLWEAAYAPPVSYEGFTTAWQRLQKKALEKGLQERFTFHDLRAKAGSEAIDWRLLGHTDRGTFERIYNRKPIKILTGS
jgi:integrase